MSNRAFYAIVIGVIVTLYCLLSPMIKCERFENGNLQVVTVITDESNENYQKLKRVAELHGIPVVGLVSSERIGHGFGFGMKLKMLSDYIQALPDNKLIVFVDGYDVLITAPNASEIERRYLQLTRGSGKALFSAEMTCWPDAHLSTSYPKCKSEYKYLNAGTLMAPVKTFKRIFELCPIPTDKAELLALDDQRYYTKFYLTDVGKDHILLDHSNEIFNCMAGGTHHLHFDPDGNKWFNKSTGTYPIIYHANGSAQIKDFLYQKIYPTQDK